jgi:hypothetical protein
VSKKKAKGKTKGGAERVVQREAPKVIRAEKRAHPRWSGWDLEPPVHPVVIRHLDDPDNPWGKPRER